MRVTAACSSPKHQQGAAKTPWSRLTFGALGCGSGGIHHTSSNRKIQRLVKHAGEEGSKRESKPAPAQRPGPRVSPQSCSSVFRTMSAPWRLVNSLCSEPVVCPPTSPPFPDPYHFLRSQCLTEQGSSGQLLVGLFSVLLNICLLLNIWILSLIIMPISQEIEVESKEQDLES